VLSSLLASLEQITGHLGSIGSMSRGPQQADSPHKCPAWPIEQDGALVLASSDSSIIKLAAGGQSANDGPASSSYYLDQNVLQGIRSFGLDLPQPVVVKVATIYKEMTPMERFLVEKDIVGIAFNQQIGAGNGDTLSGRRATLGCLEGR
jgi:hypothetical protein